MVLLSIIIPVYNSKDYLESCLLSVFCQCWQEKIEIICIDDGSTDASPEIIQKFFQHDNLRLISQSNKGVSVARNKGIERAKGRYITFVDSDDWLDNDFAAKVIPLLEENYYDCLLFGLCEYHEGKYASIGTFSFSGFKSGNSEDMLKSMMNYHSPYRGYACGKIIKRTCLINNSYPVCFDEDLSLFEDELFWVKAASNCKTVLFSSESFYYYRQNPGTLSSGFSDSKSVMELEARERVLETINMNFPSLSYLAIARLSLSVGGIIRKCYQYGDDKLLNLIRSKYWKRYPVRLVFRLDGAGPLLKIGALICDLAVFMRIPTRILNRD